MDLLFESAGVSNKGCQENKIGKGILRRGNIWLLGDVNINTMKRQGSWIVKSLVYYARN